MRMSLSLTEQLSPTHELSLAAKLLLRHRHFFFFVFHPFLFFTVALRGHRPLLVSTENYTRCENAQWPAAEACEG